jgi:hypothetical protein
MTITARQLALSGTLVAALYVLALYPAPPALLLAFLAAVIAVLFTQARHWSGQALTLMSSAALLSRYLQNELGNCPTIGGGGLDIALFTFILAAVLGVALLNRHEQRLVATSIVAGVCVVFLFPLSDTTLANGTIRLGCMAILAGTVLALHMLSQRFGLKVLSELLAPIMVLLPTLGFIFIVLERPVADEVALYSSTRIGVAGIAAALLHVVSSIVAGKGD